MEKKRLFKILSGAQPSQIQTMADKLKKGHSIIIVKEPDKSLAMIKMREPVKSSLFYLGEVIITEAIVTLDGVKGMAVQMGDDFENVLNMAIIDAACNKGIFADYDLLLALEAKQLESIEKENAMFMKTKVDFSSMNTEVQP